MFNLPISIENIHLLKIKKIKTISEGPNKVIGRHYLQYRHLDVYELIESDVYNRQFLNFLKIE